MRSYVAPGAAILACAVALLLLTGGLALAQEAAPAAAAATQVEILTVTSATRTYSWEITKSVEPPTLDLDAGASRNLSYTIQLTRVTQTSDAQVGGLITLTNPGGPAANVTQVTVEVQNMGTTDAGCGGFPLDLGANAEVVCTYAQAVINAAQRTVTATVYIDGAAGPSAVAVADFTPPNVENPIGPRSVYLTDPAGGYSDRVVNGSRAFTYTAPFACPADPAEYNAGPITTEITNTATITPTDQSASTSVMATCSLADSTPPPATACVRGQGYWKTHSDYGPATPPDDTWDDAFLPEGEDTLFFESGLSWIDMMWEPPKQGSAYIILAHKYIPAQLNIAAGAPTNPALDAALVQAEEFFGTHAPDEHLDKDVRKATIHLAGLLNNYNDGVVIAPVCGDDAGDDPNEDEENSEIGVYAADGSRVLFGTVLLPLVESN